MPPKKPTAAPSGKAGSIAPEQVVFTRPTCSLTITKGGEPYGKLTFEIATDSLPRTTENFKQLSQGVTVGDKKNPKTAAYKNCRFLRLTAEGLQTGDALNREDGKGNDSIYGTTFDDEQMHVYPHKLGTLSMCNSGPNTNGSQFFICLAEAPHLDPRHVSFGKLLEGFEVLESLRGEIAQYADETSGKVDAACPFSLASVHFV